MFSPDTTVLRSLDAVCTGVVSAATVTCSFTCPICITNVPRSRVSVLIRSSVVISSVLKPGAVIRTE